MERAARHFLGMGPSPALNAHFVFPLMVPVSCQDSSQCHITHVPQAIVGAAANTACRAQGRPRHPPSRVPGQRVRLSVPAASLPSSSSISSALWPSTLPFPGKSPTSIPCIPPVWPCFPRGSVSVHFQLPSGVQPEKNTPEAPCTAGSTRLLTLSSLLCGPGRRQRSLGGIEERGWELPFMLGDARVLVG